MKIVEKFGERSVDSPINEIREVKSPLSSHRDYKKFDEPPNNEVMVSSFDSKRDGPRKVIQKKS